VATKTKEENMSKLMIGMGLTTGFFTALLSFFKIFLPLSLNFPSNPDNFLSAGGMLNLGLWISIGMGVCIFWIIEKIATHFPKNSENT